MSQCDWYNGHLISTVKRIITYPDNNIALAELGPDQGRLLSGIGLSENTLLTVEAFNVKESFSTEMMSPCGVFQFR